jgi:formylmethanofuran dehydrogenase subunit E
MSLRKHDLPNDQVPRVHEENCSCGQFGESRRKFFRKMTAIGIGIAGGAFACRNGDTAEHNSSAIIQVPVPIPDVSIPMRCPDAFLVGVSGSEIIEIKLADVLKFHGYCAGGVAFAFRASQEAFRILFGKELPVRQSVKVQTAHHCCQAGALAYITGARSDFGAERSVGDLVLIPKESRKMVFTEKRTARQVTLRPLFDPHDTFKPLFRRVVQERELAPKVQQILRDEIQKYIFGPKEALFQIEKT